MKLTKSPGNMSELEARTCVDKIKGNLSSIRADLLDLQERNGWMALGYASMRACLQEEFPNSPSHLYRQLSAGMLEKELSSPIGDHRESHLRPLIRILGSVEEQREAYSQVIQDNPTALDFQRAAMWVHVSGHGPDELERRMRAGEISPLAAYKICREIEGQDEAFIRIASMCSDPDIVPMIKRLFYEGTDTWIEIVSTMCIPSVDEQIPLGRASASSLMAYLNIASNEHRAASIASNGEYYAALREATDEVIKQARKEPHAALMDALYKYDEVINESKSRRGFTTG